jgi:NHLM bacteriocin system ABC transporter ATP-binding protein
MKNRSLAELLSDVPQEEFSGRDPVFVGLQDLCIVLEGEVEVFLVEDESEDSFVRRSFLYEAFEDAPIFGLHTPDNHRVVIVPVVPTRLVKARFEDCWERFVSQPELFEQYARDWVQRLGLLIEPESLPVLAHQLPDVGEVSIKNRGSYYANNLCRVQIKEGKIHSARLGKLSSQEEWLLMLKGDWFTAEPNTRIQVHDFSSTLGEANSRLGTQHFYARTLLSVAERKKGLTEEDKQRINLRAEKDDSIRQRGWSRLFQVLNPPPPEVKVMEGGDPLLAACYLVGKNMGEDIRAPERYTGNRPLDDIARASGVRVRRVKLEDHWWTLDSGPILAWTKDENRPIALIPPRPGAFDAIDPQTGQKARVTEQNANDYSPLGAVFQPRLPDRPIGLKELFALGLKNSRMDLLVLLLLGAGTGILALSVPVATKYFFDQILPSGNLDHLRTLLIALFLVTLTNVCFALSRSVALVRFGGRFGSVIAGTMFDRLLTLRMPFYRQYALGDLAQRSMGVTRVRELVTGGTLNKVVTSVFSLLSFLLLLYYDLELALIASALLAIDLVYLVYNGFEQLKAQRKAATLSGEVNGVLYQILDALPKIRVAGAESRFFAYWSKRFGQQMESEYRSGSLSVAQSVFTATFPVISTFILFAYVGYAHDPIQTGTLLAFLAAFAQCTSGIAGLSESALEFSEAWPQLERTRPILAATPEVDEQKSDPGFLKGKLTLNNVTFRYIPDQPPVLNGVSLTVEPGEFVALVGGTGAGKSTILNLLLGFDRPEAGAVFFDGQDLQTLDIQAVRQQLGVVLQDGRIIKDTVFRNLATGRPITEEQAWDALQMVGLQDDIEAMPDGLNTVISEKVFSGGQSQRLLIARAIVTRPRIIIFDEATSALDNKTQSVVSKSLDDLNAARVVVAHRLSTIRGADRIYVFEHGKVVQTGTFEKLASQVGLFQELIGRQQA